MRWVWDRLCGRAWFWPRAAWQATKWVGDLVTHPVTAALSLAVVILGFGGVILVFHPNVLVVFWAVAIALILLLGKGARLMWQRDRLPLVSTETAGQTIRNVENVENLNVTHNHYYTGPPQPRSPGDPDDPNAGAPT